jgi:DNA-binding MarR family transcriptional regulator
MTAEIHRMMQASGDSVDKIADLVLGAGAIGVNPSSQAAIEREIAFLVRALEAMQRLRTYPMERAHYLMLRLIDAEGPQAVATIAYRLLLDDSTVTRQVAEMERQKLVEKNPNPSDRRSAIVAATPFGLEQARRMHEMRLERIHSLMDPWSDEERTQFAGLLRRLNRSLISVVRGHQAQPSARVDAARSKKRPEP